MALFKKVSAATLSLLITAGCVSVSAADSLDVVRFNETVKLTSKIGDANNDGVVSTVDFTTLRSALVNEDAEVYNYDFNLDGYLTAGDLIFHKKVMVGEELVQVADVYGKYTKMLENFNKLEAYNIKSLIQYKKNAPEVETNITKNSGKYQVKSNDMNVILAYDSTEKKVIAHKEVNPNEWNKVTDVPTDPDKLIESAYNTAAGTDDTLNMVENIILNKLSADSFANAYSYESKEAYAVAIPAGDVVKGATGTYVIKMDKDCNFVSVETLIGSAGTLVEGGVAFISTSNQDVNITVPTYQNPDGPGVQIPEVQLGEEVKGISVADIIKNSAKNFANIENSVIHGETTDKFTNNNLVYTNSTVVDAVREGNNVKADTTGTLNYDGTAIEYTQEAYAVLDIDNKSADVCSNTTVKTMGITYDTKWTETTVSKDLKNDKSKAVSAAKDTYIAVVNDMITAKEKELEPVLAKVAAYEKLAEINKDAEELKSLIKVAGGDDRDALVKQLEDLNDQADKIMKDNNISADTVEADKAEIQKAKENLEAEKAAFEEFKNNAKDAVTAQTELVLPSKSYIQDMLADESARQRINNNSTLNEREGYENQLVITLDLAGASKDTQGDFIKSVDGSVKYVVEIMNPEAVKADAETNAEKYADCEFKPLVVKVENTTAVASDKTNAGVNATVTDTYITVEYPSATTVDMSNAEKTGKTIYDRLAESRFVEFASQVISKLVNVEKKN